MMSAKVEIVEDSLSGKETPTSSAIDEVLQAINSCPTNFRHLLNKDGSQRNGVRSRRGNRMKVYDNGYIFTYDKDSQCGQRSFWRCERKSECQARVHTNPATNQIIKRINEHTHSPPNRDELPPWYVLNQTSPEPDDTSNGGNPPLTGVLLNKRYLASDPNAQLSNMVERELEQEVTTPIVKIEEPPEEEEEETHEITVIQSPGTKKKRTKYFKDGIDIYAQNEHFWELFEATKKSFDSLKHLSKNLPSTSSNSSSCDRKLSAWLKEHKLEEYKEILSKYNLEVLQRLSIDDCVSLLGNQSDAFLLYHSLRMSPNSVINESSVKVFLAERFPIDCDHEPIYQMLELQEKSVIEFQQKIALKGIIPNGTRLCVVGPGGIAVELSDEIMSSWPSEVVYQFSVIKGICKLSHVS